MIYMIAAISLTRIQQIRAACVFAIGGLIGPFAGTKSVASERLVNFEDIGGLMLSALDDPR